MAGLQQRGNKWRAKVRVPAAIRRPSQPSHVYRTLEARDRPTAKLEAAAWEVALKAEWAEKSPAPAPRAALRALYDRLREEAASGAFRLEGDPDADPTAAGIAHEIDKLEEEAGEGDLSPRQEVRLAALQDAEAEARRQPVPPRPEMEPTFAETAADYLELWKVTPGLRQGNTKQQKEATFRLFAGHLGDRPIREVRRADVAAFVDALRRLDPQWARSPRGRSLPWRELVREFGGRDRGLSDATVNRHIVTLQEVWRWAEERGRCSGSNPFTGHRRRLRPGVNVRGYLPWEPGDLGKLFNPPPARQDVAEIMLVALFTGMRLDEIASLTFGQIREAEGIPFIQIEDAKTPAGRRQVPIHSRLSWLAKRKGKPEARVWPGFNEEGPGKKAGADAGREFSRFKAGRGYQDRALAFHSFRKNVTQCLERAQVSVSEAAQILGHAREFTFATYSPHGITLQRKAEMVALIDYPGLALPSPA